MLLINDGWNLCFIHPYDVSLAPFVPSLPGPRVIATLSAGPQEHFKAFFLFFSARAFTVIHHHHTRVCSVICNYLVAIFLMQFSGGCMIGWWCQGQVRKQYFQHGEGLVATFLSNPFNQLRHSTYCLNLHHNLENRTTESVIRSAQIFGSICEKKLHFGIDWFWFERHSQQLGKPIGALIVSSRFHLHFLPEGSQFQQLFIAGVHTICGICYLRSILAP